MLGELAFQGQAQLRKPFAEPSSHQFRQPLGIFLPLKARSLTRPETPNTSDRRPPPPSADLNSSPNGKMPRESSGAAS